MKPTPGSDQDESHPTIAELEKAGRVSISQIAGRTAARTGWDADAERYQREHGDYLAGPRDGDVVWSPEGWLESELELLGPAAGLAGLTVLDLGCGAAQAARWLASKVSVGGHSAGRVIGVDISHAQLTFAQNWQAEHPQHPRVELIQADAHELPLATASVDVIVSAFGVLAFVPDLTMVLCEAARALRHGGHATVSMPHPVRWMFPDDPVASGGLTVTTSYFDRTPYAEISKTGEVVYAEYHHTLEDLMNACAAAGLVVTRLWEPQWRGDRMRTFGGWSAETVDWVPKTLIVRLEHK